jgi:hypothetical protein
MGFLLVNQTGRYYLSLNGGQLYDSAPAFVGPHAELQYSINISYSTCEPNLAVGNRSEDRSSDCPLDSPAAALEIAPPPPADAHRFPSVHYKPANRLPGGCVDSLWPTLRYTFLLEQPQWEMMLTVRAGHGRLNHE